MYQSLVLSASASASKYPKSLAPFRQTCLVHQAAVLNVRKENSSRLYLLIWTSFSKFRLQSSDGLFHLSHGLGLSQSQTYLCFGGLLLETRWTDHPLGAPKTLFALSHFYHFWLMFSVITIWFGFLFVLLPFFASPALL